MPLAAEYKVEPYASIYLELYKWLNENTTGPVSWRCEIAKQYHNTLHFKELCDYTAYILVWEQY